MTTEEISRLVHMIDNIREKENGEPIAIITVTDEGFNISSWPVRSGEDLEAYRDALKQFFEDVSTAHITEPKVVKTKAVDIFKPKPN